MIEPLIFIDAQDALDEIERLERMLRDPGKALYRWAKAVQRGVGKNTRKRGNKPYWRQISRSFAVSGWGNIRYVRSYNPAAGRMEHGGVITPKQGKFLAVPIKANDGGDGRTNKHLRSIRNDKNTFILKSKKNNLLIVRKDGRSKSKIIPVFALKKRVIQSPHPFIISRSEILRLGIAAFEARLLLEAGSAA